MADSRPLGQSVAKPPYSDDCRYFLAKTGVRGVAMGVQLVDGCHGSPEGVAEAAKLYKRIFSDNGPWVMVEIHPLPDLDPTINEQAADDCRALLEGRLP